MVRRPRPELEPNARKIAVLRANALGDFIFTLPALEALRAAYPHAEIVLLGGEWHRQFLAGRPGPVDRVIVIPPYGGVSAKPGVAEDPAALQRFFTEMAGERFDLAIQLHGGGRHANPFVQRLGAKLTVGLKAPDAPPLDRSLPYVYFQHEIVRYLEVVSLVGATQGSLEPRVSVTGTDLQEVERLVPRLRGKVVALHPGATDPRRRWPPEKFAVVGDALSAAGARVVVTGTEDERAVVQAVVDAMAADAQDLAGRLSISGLAGLLSCCRVVVSNDSGPLHLAAAVGAATVGIFWCFNLVNTCPLTRARHRPHASWRLACPICGADSTRGRCEHEASWVAEVPVEEVVQSALDFFSYPG